MEGTYSIYSHSYIQSYIVYIQTMQHQTAGGMHQVGLETLYKEKWNRFSG